MSCVFCMSLHTVPNLYIIFMHLYRSNFIMKILRLNISGTNGPIFIKFTGLIQ